MKIITIFIMVLSFTAIISGCLDRELTNPDVALDVTGAELWGNHCGEVEWKISGSEDCHQFKVTVDNQNEEKDLETDYIWWSAQDGSGGVYDAIGTHGPNRIAAGGIAEVVVLLAGDLDSTYAKIRYEYIWMDQPEIADIPMYPTPKLGITTSGTPNGDTWQLRVTSSTHSLPLTQYTFTLTTPQDENHKVSFDSKNSDSGQATCATPANNCWTAGSYEVSFSNIQGNNLAVGERLTINGDFNTSGRYTAELIHQPTESSAGSLTRAV